MTPMTQQPKPSVAEVRAAIESNNQTIANHLKNYSDEIIAEATGEFIRRTTEHPSIEWGAEFAFEYIRRLEECKNVQDP